MITDTTIRLAPDDLYPPARAVTSDDGTSHLNLLPTLSLIGGREQLADLLRAGLTALYGGHLSVDAEATRWGGQIIEPNGLVSPEPLHATRWQFGALGMEEVTDDDE